MAYFSLAIFHGPRLPRGFAQGAGALFGTSGEEHATDSAEAMASSVVSWEFVHENLANANNFNSLQRHMLYLYNLVAKYDV